MKKILNLLIISISIIISIGISIALDIPEIDGYVFDQTNSLTTEQEQILESKIYETRQNIDIEIGILIINSLEGEDIFNYSLNIAETRGVGDKEKDNGLLMLFAMKDRERRIQVGYGLEGIITDSIAKRFGEKNITNNFRDGLYFDGINNTLEDIISYIKKDPATLEYINANTNNLNNNTKSNNNGDNYFFGFIIFIFLIKSLVLKYDPKSKKSKIKKGGRITIVIIGAIMGLISYRFIFQGQLIQSGIFGYIISIAGVFIGMFVGKTTLLQAMLLGGRSGKGGSGGGSFGGFGGGGFGGGGGGGKR